MYVSNGQASVDASGCTACVRATVLRRCRWFYYDDPICLSLAACCARQSYQPVCEITYTSIMEVL